MMILLLLLCRRLFVLELTWTIINQVNRFVALLWLSKYRTLMSSSRRLVGAGDDFNVVAILTVGKEHRLGLGQSIKSIKLDCRRRRTWLIINPFLANNWSRRRLMNHCY